MRDKERFGLRDYWLCNPHGTHTYMIPQPLWDVGSAVSHNFRTGVASWLGNYFFEAAVCLGRRGVLICFLLGVDGWMDGFKDRIPYLRWC